MTFNPIVSVIIPTHNRSHYITDALESVLEQTYGNIEIIVVDDGSTDGTEKALEPYQDRILYLQQNNEGAASARNFGIRKASGHYIAFLDSDDLYLPKKIERQVDALKNNEHLGFVFCNSLFCYEDGVEIPMLEDEAPSGYIFPKLFMHNFISTNTILIKRECLEKVGTFKDMVHAEDYDLWLRLARIYDGIYLDEILAKTKFHSSNISASNSWFHNQEATLSVLLSTIDLYPTATNEIGKPAVRERIYPFLKKFSYHYFDTLDLPTSRSYYKLAIKYSPQDWRNYGYYLATLLPPALVTNMRQLKRSASKHIEKPYFGRQA